jgi:hypothetical protein
MGRTGAQAVELSSGDVLVVGNYNVCTPGWAWPDSVNAEVYDHSTGTWHETGSLNAPRDEFAAEALLDGRAVVTAGVNDAGVSYSSTKIFDPVKGSWSASGLLSVARTDPAYAVLSDGRLLVAGGEYMDESRSNVLASAEIYDPATGHWSNTGSMHTTRVSAQAVTLSDGRVLVVGGIAADTLSGTNPSSPQPVASAEIWDPTTGAWSSAGTLAQARSEFVLVALKDGSALVAGGFGTPGAVATAERYEPSTNSWTPAGTTVAAAARRSAAVLAGGRVLLAGGMTAQGSTNKVISSAELFDPVSGTWTATKPLPMALERAAGVLLKDGSVLLVGGDSGWSLPIQSIPACPSPVPQAVRYVPGQ